MRIDTARTFNMDSLSIARHVVTTSCFTLPITFPPFMHMILTALSTFLFLSIDEFHESPDHT
jgi:hypothetical protein